MNSDMQTPNLRVTVLGQGDETARVSAFSSDALAARSHIPIREWCLSDDVLSVADSASFTVANVDGENAGKFQIGDKIALDEQHPEVANGAWVRQFTGRVTSIETGSDAGGGSVIVVGAMDLGWHLTSSCAKPLQNLNGIRFHELLEKLIHPTWGIKPPTNDALGNTKLKQGRLGVTRNLAPKLGAVLPYIQTEIGQTPWDIIAPYASREGYLVNIGADGELIYFRPDYAQPALYRAIYHGARDSRRNENNLTGRPAVHESIDGYYTRVQCWSTVVRAPAIQNTENPNASYTRSAISVDDSPLHFFRELAFSDCEAINHSMREQYARWRQGKAEFGCWEYTAEFPSHHQGGHFFTSNSMVTVDDSVNGVPLASYYVQRVQRSVTLRGGTKTKMLIRKPRLLDPTLHDFNPKGGGARRVQG